MEPMPRQHCWECRRRCLVCDFTQPACSRCRRDGVDCPGYGASKPKRLKWLTPGKVVSRIRKARQLLAPEISRQFSDRLKPTVTRGITMENTLSASSDDSISITLQQLPMMPDERQLFEAVEYCTYLNKLEVLQCR